MSGRRFAYSRRVSHVNVKHVGLSFDNHSIGVLGEYFWNNTNAAPSTPPTKFLLPMDGNYTVEDLDTGAITSLPKTFKIASSNTIMDTITLCLWTDLLTVSTIPVEIVVWMGSPGPNGSPPPFKGPNPPPGPSPNFGGVGGAIYSSGTVNLSVLGDPLTLNISKTPIPEGMVFSIEISGLNNISIATGETVDLAYSVEQSIK